MKIKKNTSKMSFDEIREMYKNHKDSRFKRKERTFAMIGEDPQLVNESMERLKHFIDNEDEYIKNIKEKVNKEGNTPKVKKYIERMYNSVYASMLIPPPNMVVELLKSSKNVKFMDNSNFTKEQIEVLIFRSLSLNREINSYYNLTNPKDVMYVASIEHIKHDLDKGIPQVTQNTKKVSNA